MPTVLIHFFSDEKGLHKRAEKSKFDKQIVNYSISDIFFSKIRLSNNNNFYGRNLCSFTKHMLKVHVSNLQFQRDLTSLRDPRI